MGDVYRARDRLTGGYVAIKLLHPGLAKDSDRFRREAQLLAEISHPRIVRYVAHGVTQTTRRPYIAMEWLDGEDVADRLARGGFTMQECVLLGRCAAEALGALHERGIVHRDIKPSNLFLPGGDIRQVKLLDLGIARLTSPTRRNTRSGVMVGTPGYMAPEQARGANELDASADIFSLGCVLFECLTGRPAFVGENVAALLAKILLDETPRVVERVSTVPPALDDLVTRMLSKHPGARPVDGHALARELAAFPAVSLDSSHRSDVQQLRAITRGERRLVSVVLAAPTEPSSRSVELEEDAASGAAPAGAPGTARDTMVASYDLRSVISPFGAHFEPMADGSIVVAVSGKGTATDQVAHAARCALSLRDHMPTTQLVLATGLATVTQRSLVGEVIDRAAKMLAETRSALEQKGPEGTDRATSLPLPVRLDETTAGLLDLRFEVSGDERGLALVGLRVKDSATTRTVCGKPTACIGRDRELGGLLALFDEVCKEPVARAVLVTSPPGGGKSRLLHEFLQRVQEVHPTVEIWIARGDPMSEGSPFSMLAQGVRRTCGIVEGEPLVVRRQKLRARLGRNLQGDDLTRVSEFLGEVIGTPFEADSSVQLRAARQDPMLMGDQMRSAFRDLVISTAATQPIVAVLEDLHWGDLPSVKFIDAALRGPSALPMMVLAAARPEVHEAFPGLWTERGLQEIRLGPLMKSASEKLVKSVLGEGVGEARVAALVERSAGNAFYLEELIRAEAEGRGNQIPETVLAMVEARLERLEPDARRLLRAASVFGQVFWRSGVIRLLGGGDHRGAEFDEWIRVLKDRELAVRRRAAKFAGEQEFAFRHALVREAAYAMLTPDDRTLGHFLAGEWLEHSGECEGMVLAEHFERGGVPTRAVEWYKRAAEQGLEGNDFEATIARAEGAVACGATGEVLGHLRLLQATASDWNEEKHDGEKYALEAMAQLTRGSPDWFMAAGETALLARLLGHFERVKEIAEDVRAMSGRGNVTIPRIEGTAHVAEAVFFTGALQLGEDLLRALHDMAGSIALEEPSVAARIHSAHAIRAVWLGEVEDELFATLAAVVAFEKAGDARNACLNRANAGHCFMYIGAFAEAERELRTALALAEKMGLRNTSLLAKTNLGQVLGRLGRRDESLAVLREAMTGAAAQGSTVLASVARTYLGMMLRLFGDRDAAEREVRPAIEGLKSAHPLYAAGLAALAYVQLDRGQSHEGFELAREAMQMFRTLGGVSEGESFVRLAYAEALYAAGEHDAARAAIAEARDRLLARAERIKNAEWRKSFLQKVGENAKTLARAGEWIREPSRPTLPSA
jgi:tetratricopeptide (TPR) repeat protein